MSPPLELPPDGAGFACADIDCMRWTSHSGVGARQSPGSSVHVATRRLSSRATEASHGLRQPKGGRKNLDGAPRAAVIASWQR